MAALGLHTAASINTNEGTSLCALLEREGHAALLFLHYDKLVQRYIIYDDASTDNSQGILRLNPKVELRPMPQYSDPESRIRSALALQETCWKESRGIVDWVIMTDIDEHLYHPDMYQYLAQCRAQGVTIIPALGYQMLSEQFPEQKKLLCHSLTKGACYSLYSKLNIFSPSEIDAVNYTPGRHKAAPTGHVVLPARDELLLLHYHYLGFERVRKRYAQFLTRQRKTDIAMGFGGQYSWSSEQLRDAWNFAANRLVDISQPNLRPWGNPRGTTLVEGTSRVMERIEPSEAMANAGASEGTEVYRAAAGFVDRARALKRKSASAVS